jgi:hypothetical protein
LDCLKQNNKVCNLGPSSAQCCTGTSCALSTGKTLSFCSDLAQTYSMKFTFCPFDPTVCMTQDSLLPQSVLNVKQVLFTPPTLFTMNKNCYWVISPPSEFTADIVLQVRFDQVQGTECYLNYGGAIQTAGNEQTCVEGQTYTFTYQTMGVSSVYVIAVATANNAQLKFTYWAEPRMSFQSIVLIMTFSVVALALCAWGAFVFLVDCTIKQSLEETVQFVKGQFTQTIEEMEPGKTGIDNSQADLMMGASPGTSADINHY